MKIKGREIGPSQSPYIVAEVGASHGGDLNTAILLMGAAIGAGADAVKFQAYTPSTITLVCDKPDFIVKDGPWKGRKLYELYEKAHTPFEWFPELFRVARDYNTTIFASVFDKSSIDMLERLDCPAYKIASMEIVDIPLIKYVAATGKPLIISTGMASDEEIEDAVKGLDEDNFVLLGCVSGYPTPLAEASLCRLDSIRNWYYPCYAQRGISDHTKGWEVPVAATALGASIIEKHTGLWNNTSEDAAFSLNPDEFRQMCEAVRAIWKAMQPSEAKSEEPSRQLRRSLYVVEDMKAGDVFTEQNVRSIRPGYGMAPKELPSVLGRQATMDIARGIALSSKMVWSKELMDAVERLHKTSLG